MKIIYWLKGDPKAYAINIAKKKWLNKMEYLNVDRWQELRKVYHQAQIKKEVNK